MKMLSEVGADISCMACPVGFRINQVTRYIPLESQAIGQTIIVAPKITLISVQHESRPSAAAPWSPTNAF